MLRDLRLIVPLENENRWTDLLAVLVSNDPESAAIALGLGDVAGRQVTVQREVRATRHDRIDLCVFVDGSLHTVVEAKVLSGLGPQQLERYADAYPEAHKLMLLHPEMLVVDPGPGSRWQAQSWESVVRVFSRSRDSWVAETSAAWLEHLTQSHPPVDADTTWNSLNDGDAIPFLMRVRMSWVYHHLAPPEPLTADFMPSGGNKAWVARMQLDATKPGYVAALEVEDTSARLWPARYDSGVANPVRGPRMWLGLRQHDVTTSENFDWYYLASLWTIMQRTRSDWVSTRPGLPTAHDRTNWKSIGAPIGLGHGFGHREAIRSHACMFGARVQFPADITLGRLASELNDAATLLLDLARYAPV